MHLAPFRTGSALSILALAAAPLHGQSVKLSGPLPPGASVTSFAADPTGETVVYTADARTPGKIELYAVGIDASAPPYRLSAPLQPRTAARRRARWPPRTGSASTRSPRPAGTSCTWSTRRSGTA